MYTPRCFTFYSTATKYTITRFSLLWLDYRIAQNFDGGKFYVFDAFQLDRQIILKNTAFTGVW